MFAGRGAVITGAASGIGQGLAREAARRGMRLVLADRDAAGLAAIAGDLPDALAVPTDVTDPAAVEALAKAAYRHLDTVDLLFNNAGIMATGFTWEIDPARWDASLAVNVGGVLNGLRAFVPRMIAKGHSARIVNTASVGGFGPSPLMSPYSATKFAVVALTESLKGELDMLGLPIAVSLLAPGPVRSAIFDDPFSGPIHPATEAFVDHLRSMTGAHGMDPQPFAAAVFDAIDRGEYWIVPQPEALDPMLDARHAMIRDRAPPRFAF
jgi:NAD(P)-dependent dehydrogenase (short-subunit alcohol dehydrogenase family)